MSSSYWKHLLLNQTNHKGLLNDADHKSGHNYPVWEKIFIIIINKKLAVKPLIAINSYNKTLKFFSKN